MNIEILELAKEEFRDLRFGWRDKLSFSKGYKEYEFVYELSKDLLELLGFKRIEEKHIGYTIVTIEREKLNEL